jgi:hypothetical protein
LMRVSNPIHVVLGVALALAVPTHVTVKCRASEGVTVLPRFVLIVDGR